MAPEFRVLSASEVVQSTASVWQAFSDKEQAAALETALNRMAADGWLYAGNVPGFRSPLLVFRRSGES